MLVGLSVEDSVIEKMTSDGCLNIPLFATWVDKIEEVTSVLPENLRGNPASKSKLKQAWKRAVSSNEKAIKRLSEGFSEEAVDEPLPPDVQRDIVKTAADHYRWGKIDSRRILADRGFAKIRKEFQGWQPSNYPLSKAKSLYEDKKDAPSKRQRISDDLFLTVKEMGDEQTSLNIITIGERLRMMATTWTVCGCYDVPLQLSSVERVKMCSWEDADFYVYEITSRIPVLREKFTDPSVVKYLNEMHEHFMAIARDQTRSSQQIPWGKALLNALRSEAHKWQEFRDSLMPRDKQGKGKHGQENGKGSGSQGSQFQNPSTPNPPQKPFKGKDGKNGKNGKGKISWVPAAEDGKTFCANYNTKGCRDGDNCRHLHACNALMPSGKPCGSKSHARSSHQAARDGVPQYS